VVSPSQPWKKSPLTLLPEPPTAVFIRVKRLDNEFAWNLLGQRLFIQAQTAVVRTRMLGGVGAGEGDLPGYPIRRCLEGQCCLTGLLLQLVILFQFYIRGFGEHRQELVSASSFGSLC